MKKNRPEKHMVDFLFPVALFFVFALCALAVILFAAKVYKNTVDANDANSAAKTATAYITEKVHQNDCGDVSLSDFDGKKALLIGTYYDGVKYNTYIYEDEGSIKELFAEDNTTLNLSSGTKIMEIESLEFEELKEGLFKVVCTETDGSKSVIVVGARSVND